MRIWIVEDNSADVYLLREALSTAGLDFEADLASDGEQVSALIETLNREKAVVPDAIILDLQLTNCWGTELLERCRATTALAKVPIVVLTGSNSAVDRECASRLGATAYFQKSMDLDTLLKIGQEMALLLQPNRISKTSANAMA